VSNTGRPPVSRITIADIAERAGVSIGAVSFALNGRKGVSEDTRERVRRVAEEMGWAPTRAARALAGARTDTFGLVLARDPHTLGVETFYTRFIAGMESELAKRSYGLLLQVVPSRAEELTTIKKWRASRHVDGLLLVDLAADDARVALCAEPNAIPAVVVGDPSVAGGLTSVWTDDATSMRQAVRHLSRLGHRRIAHVSGLGDSPTRRSAITPLWTNRAGSESNPHCCGRTTPRRRVHAQHARHSRGDGRRRAHRRPSP